MSRQRKRREEGTSAIELVLYMPLLMVAIIISVQFGLMYLGNQAVSAAAREASRTARVTGNDLAGEDRGRQYARDLGRGLLANVVVDVDPRDGGRTMVTEVTADGEQLLPFIPLPKLSETIEGPVEQFVEDDG
ncbi:MAG: TadE/TadG family type IV pilus assembly protein [Aeromicrobium sp.]